MTLTQSAARLPGPSWDETIVPALRKRLQSESRTLSKRMSAASISSLEEHQMSLAQTADTIITASRNASPRPSLSQTRTTTSSTMGSSAQARSPPSSRSRTYSQPYAIEPQVKRHIANGIHQPEPIRSVSPAVIKPTRIPKARTRTGSTSSHNHPANGHSHSHSTQYTPAKTNNDYSRNPNSHSNQDLLYSLHESNGNSSRSTVAVPISRQTSGLLNEQPPFQPGSISSAQSHNHHDDNDPYGKYSQRKQDRAQQYRQPQQEDAPPRPSVESEERPFEHWYRGEVSRNGGVGEYRVGKRMEMLEIANYGHSLKPVSSVSRPTRGSDDDLREGELVSRRRKRSGSTAGYTEKDRESLYLEEEDANGEAGRVLDEGPLTDMDVDTEDERMRAKYQTAEEEEEEDYTVGYTYEPDEDEQPSVHPQTQALRSPTPLEYPRSTTPQEYRSRSATPTSTRTSSKQTNAPPSRIPAPAPRPVYPDAAPTTPTGRAASESPFSVPSTRQTPPVTPSAQQKRRAKSPPVASASKRTRTRKEEELAERIKADNRRSVAYYPSPGDDENMMDAIPTWTQPVPRSGNWDEVVLPVVARKKGLDGHYEKADGSPRAPPRSQAIAPAPGTFGYDHSKYRPPRDDEEIPMNEFGLVDERRYIKEEEQSEQDPPENPTRRPPPIDVSPGNGRHPSPNSPAPFSQYPSPKAVEGPPPKIMVTKASLDLERGRHNGQRDDDDDAGGCCSKCVVM